MSNIEECQMPLVIPAKAGIQNVRESGLFYILSCKCNRTLVDVGLARQSSYFPLLVQRKVTKAKDTPLSLNSFASAPHPGRLAQRALADYTLRSLLRSLNGSRRLTRIPAQCKGATEGKGKSPQFRHSGEGRNPSKDNRRIGNPPQGRHSSGSWNP